MNKTRDVSRRGFLGTAGKLAAGAALLAAAPATGAAPALEEFGPPAWPPLDKVEALLHHWQRTHPDRMKLEILGRSTQGKPLWAIRLTDSRTAATDKEHALVTALHAGLERSGSNAVLAIAEWLLGDEPAAREILRRQEVVCLPIPDPDRYAEGKVSPVYAAWTLDGPRDPEHNPEAMAVKRVMDEFQPEVHADIHGTNLDFARYIMFENSAASYSNTALRPYHRDIIRQMDEAALAEGYPSDTAESDAERLFWGPGVDAMKGRLWRGRPNVYAAIYCYHHYHTLVSASEVAWERSGVLRHRRLLEIGNEVWPSEHAAGYPTRVMMANTHTMIAAYGQTAAARRRSRVELWNRLGQLTLGFVDPVVEGRAVCVCAATPAAAKRWLAAPTLEEFVAGLRDHAQMNAEPIARFTANWPAGQNNPKAWLALEHGASDGPPAPTGPIEHGLCLRLRIPYGKAEIQDLRLNGRPIASSPTDGFVQWTARGCTFLAVNLAPERLRTEDLFVVTCQYAPRVERRRWDTWRRLE